MGAQPDYEAHHLHHVFSGGLIPNYLLISKNLGLQNTWWALILPSALSAYNMIIMRTFFTSSIPYEIQEAASIDGCSPFGILLRIMLPLSGPVIAVVGLYYGVGHWNSYFPPCYTSAKNACNRAIVPAARCW